MLEATLDIGDVFANTVDLEYETLKLLGLIEPHACLPSYSKGVADLLAADPPTMNPHQQWDLRVH